MKEDKVLDLPHTHIDEIWKAADIAFRMIGDYPFEKFIAIMMDNCNKVVSVFELATSASVNQCAIELSSILKAALVSNSHRIIVAHNHPSGDKNPSKQDIELTYQLIRMAATVHMSIYDHIIVTPRKDIWTALGDLDIK